LVTFEVGSHIYVQCNLPIYAPIYAAEMTDTRHHAQLFIGWDGGLTNFLSGLALNRDPPDLCLLHSQDYRHLTASPLPGTLYFIFLS
jgi:hypothetical protein